MNLPLTITICSFVLKKSSTIDDIQRGTHKYKFEKSGIRFELVKSEFAWKASYHIYDFGNSKAHLNIENCVKWIEEEYISYYETKSQLERWASRTLKARLLE